MKNKASLVLMEQLAMVLVFALAAVVCLGIFFRAEETAEASRHREEGAWLAQNGAELLKSGEGLDVLALPEGYTLEAEEQEQELPGLKTVEVRALFEGEEVFSLVTGWQEVLP